MEQNNIFLSEIFCEIKKRKHQQRLFWVLKISGPSKLCATKTNSSNIFKYDENAF